MNNCKNKQLDELKKLGIDGLYKLILTQQEQIDRLYGAFNELINHGDYQEAEKILYGEGENFEV